MLAWPVFELNVEAGGGGMNWAVVKRGRRVGRRKVVGCMANEQYWMWGIACEVKIDRRYSR